MSEVNFEDVAKELNIMFAKPRENLSRRHVYITNDRAFLIALDMLRQQRTPEC